MGRYGAVFSQQGIPWDRANDYQKVLDSRWKFLDVYVEKYIDVTFDLTGQTSGNKRLLIYQHSLPYAAAFEFIASIQSQTSDSFANSPFDITRGLRSFKDGIYFTILWNPSFDTNTIRVKGFLRVYALDLTETYKAPSTPLVTAGPQPNARYGAKFLDPNRGGSNINETDPRKYTLYTPAKQISLHMHGIIQAVSGVVTLEHDVGYPPSYMLCAADAENSIVPHPNDDVIFGALFESFARAKANETTITFQGVQSTLGTRKFGYVITKDPVEVAG